MIAGCFMFKNIQSFNKLICQMITSELPRRTSPTETSLIKTPTLSSTSKFHDDSSLLSDIWVLYNSDYVKHIPEHLLSQKQSVLAFMFDCHKAMKLPIEVLYSSTNLLDNVLLSPKSYQKVWEQDELRILSVGCLYCCHKLQKTRTQPISNWLKNINSLETPSLQISAEIIREWQGLIMDSLNYNLITTTRFQIMLALYTIWNPSEKQFYFSQYLLELSLFSDFRPLAAFDKNRGSATTTADDSDHHELRTIEIALGIIKICQHIFPSNQVNPLQEELNKDVIDKVSNIVFATMLESGRRASMSSIVRKYEKQGNLGISCMRFGYKSS